MNARLLFACVALGACGADARPAGVVVVERTDSAGLEIVTARGGDVPLEWTFEPVSTVGSADDGPTAFGGLFPDGVAVAPGGPLVILDAGSHRVVIVDETGVTHEMGRQGGGPGEMQWPNALAVADDGTISVYDFGKRGAVRFDTAGRILDQRELPPLEGSPPRLDAALGRYWGVFGVPRSAPEDPIVERLLGIGDADTVELAHTASPDVRMVEFPNCAVRITMPPLFSPDLRFSATPDGVAFNPDGSYAISIWRDGRIVRVIRRDVPLQAATPELAAAEVGDTLRILFGSGGCSVPPEDVADARGHASHVPAVRDVALSPDGTLFVGRGVGPRTEWRIDVFAPDGAYTGTLPAGAPFPTAFRSPAELVTVERDDLDRAIVVVYRISRTSQ